MPELAAAQYAAVMAGMPGDPVIAMRTYRQAIIAGDRMLAARAAASLAASRSLPPDGRLLLMAEAVLRKDWAAANLEVDRIEEEQVFGFAVPALRAWIAQGSGKGDPIALIDARAPGLAGTPYTAEQRMLLLLVRGKSQDAIATFRSIGNATGLRATRLRLLAAGGLARGREKAAALVMLEGGEPALEIARAKIGANKPIAGTVDGPAAGIAELLLRIAVDINRERVTPLALTLARIATFLAPSNPEAWLVTSELLGTDGQYDVALIAADQVRTDDPLAGLARNSRVAILLRKGAREDALSAALAATQARSVGAADWTRLGQLYAELGRQKDAAAAFERAIAIEGDGDDLWALWLMRGGALEQAGDWQQARAALERARQIAPTEASVLNYLGYAQLERRENLDEAQKLIEQASRLQPDDAAITDSLGWAYYLRGDYQRAIVTLERAVLGEPGEPTINEHLGDAYWAAGRRIDARHAWRAALVYADQDDAARIARKIDQGPDVTTAAR